MKENIFEKRQQRLKQLEKTKMVLSFYKGFKSNDILDWIINIVTFGKYSHCELIDTSDMSCYSASIRDNGVRKKYIDFYNNPEHWDFYKIELEAKDKQIRLEYFYNITFDEPYSIFELIFAFILNISNVELKGTYCSKWISEALMFIENPFLIFKDKILPKHVTPNRLFKILNKSNKLTKINLDELKNDL